MGGERHDPELMITGMVTKHLHAHVNSCWEGTALRANYWLDLLH